MTHSSPTRMDFVQAASGVALMLFLWGHSFLVSSEMISPAVMNWIGWFFEATYLAQIFAPVLLLVMVLHFWVAARKMPFRAQELCTFWNHAKSLRHTDTWLWLVQVATAVVVLVLGSAHVLEVLCTLPITAEKSAARIQEGWLPVFGLLLVAAQIHLGIGFYRLGVKYGYITRATRPFWKKTAVALVTGFILLGVLSLTSYVHLAV